LTTTQSRTRAAPRAEPAFALFARDFDAPLDNVIVLDEAEEDAPPAEPPPPPITQAMLDEAVAAAREDGLREGRAEAAEAREAARHAMQATLINQLRDAEAHLRWKRRAASSPPWCWPRWMPGSRRCAPGTVPRSSPASPATSSACWRRSRAS
jgi:hypothetical protein